VPVIYIPRSTAQLNLLLDKRYLLLAQIAFISTRTAGRQLQQHPANVPQHVQPKTYITQILLKACDNRSLHGTGKHAQVKEAYDTMDHRIQHLRRQLLTAKHNTLSIDKSASVG
jgi:hypothetical protein